MRKYFITAILITVLCNFAYAEDKVEPEYEGKTLSEWIKLLEDKDSEIRLKAAEALAIIGDKSHTRVLLKALMDNDKTVAGRAGDALAGIYLESLDKTFAKLLQEGDAFTRAASAKALRYTLRGQRCDTRKADKGAIRALVNALQDNDKRVRDESAITIGMLGDETTIPLIAKVMQDKDKDVRGIAVTALGRLNYRVANKANPIIIKALEDESHIVRCAAVLALGDIKDKHVISILLMVLKDKHSDVRKEAALVLGTTGEKSVVAPLCKMLGDENRGVVQEAIKSLGLLGYKEVVPTLIDALKKNDNVPQIVSSLERIAMEKYGNNIAKWEQWWQENKGEKHVYSLVKQLCSAETRKAAYREIVSWGKCREKSLRGAAIKGKIKNVIECPQPEGPPIFAVFFDSGRSKEKTKGGIVLIDADGTIIPYYGGANCIEGEFEDVNGDGIIENVESILCGGDRCGYEGYTEFYVVPIIREQEAILRIAYNKGDFDGKWGWKLVKDDGSGGFDIVIGIIDEKTEEIKPEAVYKWSKEKRMYIGPQGGMDKPFIRLDNMPPDTIIKYTIVKEKK